MILDPALAKADLDALIADIKKDLEEAKLKVTKEDVWGAKDMAYKIRGSASGYYLVYTLETDSPQKLKSITTPFNIKKGLWRYLMTALPETQEKKETKTA